MMRPNDFLGQRPLRSARTKIRIALLTMGLILLYSVAFLGIICGKVIISGKTAEKMGIYGKNIPNVGSVSYVAGEVCTINMEPTTSADDAKLLFQHCLESHEEVFPPKALTEK